MATIVSSELVNGWDAGARSIAYLLGDGAFSWTVGQATGIVAGFNSENLSVDYTEISHGFFIETDDWYVVERGEAKTTPAPYPVAAVFKLERVGSAVRYYVNDVLKYTSETRSFGRVYLDCSLFAHDDSIIDLTMEDEGSANYGYHAVVTLPSVRPFGAEDGALFGFPWLPTLTTAGLDDDGWTGAATLPTPMAQGALEWVGRGTVTLPTLRVSQAAMPDFATGRAFLPLLGCIASDYPLWVGYPTLPTLSVFGTDTDGFARLNLPSLAPWGDFTPQCAFYGVWSGWSLASTIGDTVWRLVMPSPILTASIWTQRFDVTLTVPAPILTAQMGSTAWLSAPAPILTATISNPAVLRAALEVPAPTLTATINAGSLMTVALEVPAPILTASMGATVALTAPAPILTASISSVNLLRVALTVPAPTLTASISTAERLTVALECPAPILTAWFGAQVGLTVPAPILTASISSEAATAETSYAINLTTGAVTQLQLGPFDRLVTAHGRLYGLASGALLCLDSTVDGVSTPIAASVRFAPNPWGTGLLKRMECVYVLGRAPAGLLLDVIADETELWRYRLAPVDRVDYGTHKVKVGKGIHFYSAGLALHNEAGGEMDIAGLEPRVMPLSRRTR